MKSRKKLFITIVILAVLFLIAAGVLSMQRISDKDIIIEGNEKYTDEEMMEFIFKSDWDKNPFVLYYKTRFKTQKIIPFVDEYDVKITSMNSVNITVYEKKIIGYVTYMGNNMYFDKDGTVVESSTEIIEGIPRITGLNFDSIILYETLQVGDADVFNLILDTTQILQKYNIGVERIYISDNKQVTLYIGDIKVELGTNQDMNDKIRSLNDMLPNLQGQSGTLDIREHNENNEGYTFKKS